MRFLDTNILVCGLLKPRRRLDQKEMNMLAQAGRILHRVEMGEHALTSVVHLSEFVNMAENRSNQQEVCEVIHGLLSIPSLHINPVNPDRYHLAVQLSRESGVGINDCLAIVIMNEQKAHAVYSFDRDFDRLGVLRIIE